MYAEFDNSLVTGNEMIDGQHKELIGKINKLVDCCEQGGGKLEAIKMLDYLSDYTEFHFEDEESLMERIHYPKLDIQRRAHSAFIERLVGINLSELDDMDDNQQEYLLELMAFLQNWLINHILKADKLIGEYQRKLEG